jgi:hypothetical protein
MCDVHLLMIMLLKDAGKLTMYYKNEICSKVHSDDF